MRQSNWTILVAGLGLLVATGCDPRAESTRDAGGGEDTAPSDAAGCGEGSGERCDVGETADDAGDATDGVEEDDATDGSQLESSEHFAWVRYDDETSRTSSADGGGLAFGRGHYRDLEIGPEGGIIAAGQALNRLDEAEPEQPRVTGVVARYGSEGELEWRHRVDLPMRNRIWAIAVTQNGVVFAIGHRDEPSPDSPGDIPDGPGRFILTLDPQGQKVNRFEVLRSGAPRIEDVISVDDGLIVVGSDDASAHGESVGEGPDALVAKMDPATGSVDWRRFFGGDGLDRAQSVVRKGESGQLLVPVHRNVETETPGSGMLYSIGPDGEVDDGNSLPLNSSSELPHMTLQGDAIRFAGWAEADGAGKDAAVAGGTPVYPTARFDRSFGEPGFDVATDIASAEGAGTWAVGRWDHGDPGIDAGFASRVAADGDAGADIVFGDAHGSSVGPEAVAVDGDGRVYVAGATRMPMGEAAWFDATSRFVGRLRPESGP